jgi:hypothetical protein
MHSQMTFSFETQLLDIASNQCAAQPAQHVFASIGSCPRMTPNPSIEGMPKRLRLSGTPHVKR